MWLDEVIATARLDTLPVQARTRRELARVLAEEDAPLGRITLVVMSDPGLALRVLQRANAVEHRYFRREIVGLEDAIHMLGLRTLAELERQAPLAEDVLDARRLEHYRRGCGRALLAARLALDWAELERDRVPAEIALAALLNNLGELYLLARGDARINRYLEMMEEHPDVLPHEAEYVTLSTSLEALGYGLACAWNLPEMARESMRGRNARHPRPLYVMLATQIARHAFAGWRHPGQGGDLRLVSELLECDPATLCDRLDRVLDRFNERAVLYGLKPLETMPRASAADDSSWLDRRRAALFCLAPRTDELERVAAALTGRIEDRETLVLDWLHGLHRGLGLNRVVYAALDADRRTLTAEQLVGTDFEPGFNRFSLSLDRGGLFERLMTAPGALWLNASNRTELSDQVPKDVKTLTRVEAFMARSVWIGGRPVGLVYADRRSTDCALDARAYQGFLHLSALAETALERLVSQTPG
ncbi:HDOD domain-containing protein [Allochromatium tepidum]|nr:HDOD domain-containing protein [Allochromatium tepidum]